MKKSKNLLETILVPIIIILFFSSCSGLMDNMFKEFDQQEANASAQPQDQFDRFRQGDSENQEDAMFLKKSMKTSRSNSVVTSKTTPVVSPEIKREYVPKAEAKKRTAADDLNDNDNSGSLWGNTGTSNDNFLFSVNNRKKVGDIVLINVLSILKAEITMELKKAFPLEEPPAEIPDPNKKEGAEAEGEVAGKEKTPAKPKAVVKEEDNAVADIRDRISGIIVEEINAEHILIKGRRSVIFRGGKRNVEIQALVSRKDIVDDDSINSDKILESTINIIR